MHVSEQDDPSSPSVHTAPLSTSELAVVGSDDQDEDDNPPTATVLELELGTTLEELVVVVTAELLLSVGRMFDILVDE